MSDKSDKCCGGKCKMAKVELNVGPAEKELMLAIASEIEKEDPDGTDEIIRLYSENIENICKVQDV